MMRKKLVAIICLSFFVNVQAGEEISNKQKGISMKELFEKNHAESLASFYKINELFASVDNNLHKTNNNVDEIHHRLDKIDEHCDSIKEDMLEFQRIFSMLERMFARSKETADGTHYYDKQGTWRAAITEISTELVLYKK